MLDHPTHQRLRALKLDGMADAFADLQRQDGATELSHAEWLGLLIDREAWSRSAKRFQSRMRAPKLRQSGASVEDVDYRAPASSTATCSAGSPRATGSRNAVTC